MSFSFGRRCLRPHRHVANAKILVYQKTQCDFEEPGVRGCGRCLRLGLACTWDRPIRQRGRPPASLSRSSRNQPNNTTRADHASETTNESREHTGDRSPPSNSLLQCVASVAGSKIPSASITHVLRSILLHQHDLGVLSILRDADSTGETVNDLFSAHNVALSGSLLYAFVSVGLQLRPHLCPDHTSEDLDHDVNIFRSECIRRITISSCDQKLNIFDVLALVLLSHVWCFADNLALTSLRWSSMSNFMMAADLHFNHSLLQCSTNSLEQKWVASLHDDCWSCRR